MPKVTAELIENKKPICKVPSRTLGFAGIRRTALLGPGREQLRQLEHVISGSITPRAAL